ncbi:hypothetical protein ACFOY8_07735 [Thalassospira xianhensis]|uniref:HNH nuclease domain-containing protein n=1 Tax=Thalassospira xianhensis MCCC 1A02616 TaxID=1177929 RepID=A0A367U6Z6_9PROT|nr:hypothetical protein [Thalassospira xianhensis]RCK04067.1 hypothetical protein TH5_21980 [Thalassospira xianhensis MCCC 1A02616]
MIPVNLQPEPCDFDQMVRQRGHTWLLNNGINVNNPPPKASDLPNYWSHSNKQLWVAYSGVCAYLAIYFEWGTGASSTDHFIAKSANAGEAYEWSNYRLSCFGPNRNKNKYDDVLDPIGLTPETFVINFASGEISPNPTLSSAEKKEAKKTIRRLKLDSDNNNQMRAQHYNDYVSGDCSLKFLSRKSPFVHAEIVRQGLV